MYPGVHAEQRADQPAIVMAGSGEVVTYRQYEERSNRMAHLLRSEGLRRGDHLAIFMENHPWYMPVCAAGERTGLYYTPTNSHLTTDELAYILRNSESKALITTRPWWASGLEMTAVGILEAAVTYGLGLLFAGH